MFFREDCCLQTVPKISVTSREIWGQMLVGFFCGARAVTSTFIKATPCLLVSFQSGEGKENTGRIWCFQTAAIGRKWMIFEISAHIQAILSHWDLAMHCLEGTGVKGHDRSWKCLLPWVGKNIYLCPQLFAWKIKLLKGELKASCKY